MSLDFWTTLGAALLGYLIGAVSFARIVASRVSPGADISHVSQVVPGTDMTFTMRTVSATSVHTHVGKRYGCLTALLDMIKVALPTLLVRQAFPDQPYHLITAACGVVGHNWPVYYGFRGGRGESPIIGGLLVIDPLGLLAVNAIAAAAGLALGSMLVLRWSGFLLLIPWEWITTHQPARVLYVACVVLLYAVALRAELAQYIRLKRERTFLSQEAVAEFLAMGKPLGRFMDRYSLFAFLRRLLVLYLALQALSVLPHTPAAAQSILLEGQASLLERLQDTRPASLTSDLRYVPVLTARTPLGDEQELSAEMSLHTGLRMTTVVGARAVYDHTAKLYRAWARLAGAQWELRGGLQRLSFGSAVLFRPLMWFDHLDPRDPLQMTDGVPALVARYAFLSNANIWAWAVWGEDRTRGWEIFPSPKRSRLGTAVPEYGGRAQVPLFSGEAALSYHHRSALLPAILPPSTLPLLDRTAPEDRLGIDGKWDVGAGVWCEASLTRLHEDRLPAPWQRMLTVGADYSLPLAEGFQLLGEYFVSAGSGTALGRGQTARAAAASGSLTLGLLDNVTGIAYLDLGARDLYAFLDWRRTYDAWVFHLIVFANPQTVRLAPGADVLPGGTGIQVMVIFNH